MSVPVTRDTVVKKKHVRFASMEDDEDDQKEDTLFDKRKDTGRGLKNALKAVKRTTKAGCEDRVDVVSRGRGGVGRWMVTLALCAAFLGLTCDTVYLRCCKSVELCPHLDYIPPSPFLHQRQSYRAVFMFEQ